MILSVSRRTDIPNYYFDWFCRRLEEGYLYVRNPMNGHQVSRVDLSPETVDCIVFWTKNPAPMLGKLSCLAGYPYYVQFTLTGYGKAVEPGVPGNRKELIETFRALSHAIGKKRVVWRYDPILFTPVYTEEYHRKAFAEIAEGLEGYAERVVISFVDRYAKIQKNMARLQAEDMPAGRMLEFAGKLAAIAGGHGLEIFSCAEAVDLEPAGIRHGSCIDPGLIAEITGCRIDAGKDKNQRKECGCVESIEVGTYDTCRNGCLYCYANASGEAVRVRAGKYDPKSPLLCGGIGPEDRITVRKMKALKDGQLRLF